MLSTFTDRIGRTGIECTRVKRVTSAETELGNHQNIRWTDPGECIYAAAHLASSTVTKFATARGRGWARGSCVTCDLGLVVSFGLALRESDTQVTPCAVARVASWIKGIRSKKESIVEWYMGVSRMGLGREMGGVERR